MSSSAVKKETRTEVPASVCPASESDAQAMLWMDDLEEKIAQIVLDLDAAQARLLRLERCPKASSLYKERIGNMRQHVNVLWKDYLSSIESH